MTTNTERVEPKNVTMYPRHWAIVNAYAKDGGYDTTSAALRRIVDEWTQLKRSRLLIDPSPEYVTEEPA